MDGGTDPHADENVDPNPMHNLDNLIGGVGQPFAAANYTVVVVVADGALIDESLDLIFQLEIADQGSAQDGQHQTDCHIGQRNSPIENAGQYSLAKAQQSFKSLVQIHEKSGWYNRIIIYYLLPICWKCMLVNKCELNNAFRLVYTA